MNRQTFHNVNLRVAQAATAKHPKRYGSKQTSDVFHSNFLQKVGQIRTLEDELLALQYQRELLMEQNQTYSEALEKIKQNNEIQEMRLQKIEEEVEMHRMKNQQLDSCEENLKSLYEEIDGLTSLVNQKNQECDQLVLEKSRILDTNAMILAKKKELIERRSFVSVKIQDYFRSFGGFVEEEVSPIANLKIRLEDLLESQERLRMEEQKIKKQNHVALTVEKQYYLKIQYEEKLLTQRLKDIQKNEQIAKICETQSNLDNMVEDMLLKEDELVEELNRLTVQYEQGDKELRATLQKLEDDWAEERSSSERKLRETKKIYEKTCFDIEQLQSELAQKQQHVKKISIQYELMCKLKLNLTSMQRLREAEQRNNYLKLKINELNQIKQLMTQQKELTPEIRYIEQNIIAGRTGQ